MKPIILADGSTLKVGMVIQVIGTYHGRKWCYDNKEKIVIHNIEQAAAAIRMTFIDSGDSTTKTDIISRDMLRKYFKGGNINWKRRLEGQK